MGIIALIDIVFSILLMPMIGMYLDKWHYHNKGLCLIMASVAILKLMYVPFAQNILVIFMLLPITVGAVKDAASAMGRRRAAPLVVPFSGATAADRVDSAMNACPAVDAKPSFADQPNIPEGHFTLLSSNPRGFAPRVADMVAQRFVHFCSSHLCPRSLTRLRKKMVALLGPRSDESVLKALRGQVCVQNQDIGVSSGIPNLVPNRYPNLGPGLVPDLATTHWPTAHRRTPYILVAELSPETAQPR